MLSAEAVALMLDRKKTLINFGFIEYEDFSHNKFRIRFAFTYEFGEGDPSTMYIPVSPDSYWEYT
jgi:hypothetical protein